MVYAGRKLYVFGPRKLTMAGGIVLGAGYVLAGLSGGESFWPVVIGIGVLIRMDDYLFHRPLLLIPVGYQLKAGRYIKSDSYAERRGGVVENHRDIENI